ncbi:MAG: nuclear transport factor 2 family protein [Actinomycetes bacterium]|jgi:uncharacterized protein (TIGR02246 family)|nr:nuclear transport factor 2 family protein [Acidimicrobiia bacterium]
MRLDEWVESYRRAWEERDPEAAASLFTEDAEYLDYVYGEPHRGRDGVREYWADATATQSDVRVRMGEPIADGSRAMVEFWTNMTVEGNPTTLAGCLLLHFDESGLCRRLREYWFFTEGTLEPPPVWGT